MCGLASPARTNWGLGGRLRANSADCRRRSLLRGWCRPTLARAEAKLTEQAEHDWNRRVMIVVVAFAWLLTIASWPVFHFVSGRFGSLLEPQFSHTWISFAAFTALGWLAGGVAAVMLAIRQRGERRLA